MSQNKEKIANALNNDATRELAEIFWLNKEQINKLTKKETNELSDSNEVNKEEAQLAKILWKYDEIMKLNNKNYNWIDDINIEGNVLTLWKVMNELSRYEQLH
jgi:hypothetical protein